MNYFANKHIINHVRCSSGNLVKGYYRFNNSKIFNGGSKFLNTNGLICAKHEISITNKKINPVYINFKHNLVLPSKYIKLYNNHNINDILDSYKRNGIYSYLLLDRLDKLYNSEYFILVKL